MIIQKLIPNIFNYHELKLLLNLGTEKLKIYISLTLYVSVKVTIFVLFIEMFSFENKKIHSFSQK